MKCYPKITSQLLSIDKEKKINIIYKGTLDAKSSHIHTTPKTTVQVSLSHCKTIYINLTELQATKEQLRIWESFRWEKTLWSSLCLTINPALPNPPLNPAPKWPSLQSLPIHYQVNTPIQAGVIANWHGELHAAVQIIDKDIEQDRSQYWALGNTTCDQVGVAPSPTTLWAWPSASFLPSKGAPVQAMISHFLQENSVGNSTKGFTTAQVDNIQSPSLPCSASPARLKPGWISWLCLCRTLPTASTLLLTLPKPSNPADDSLKKPVCRLWSGCHCLGDCPVLGRAHTQTHPASKSKSSSSSAP